MAEFRGAPGRTDRGCPRPFPLADKTTLAAASDLVELRKGAGLEAKVATESPSSQKTNKISLSIGPKR